MDRQDQIHALSLAAHRLAVERLRERPERLGEALGAIQRWREQAGGPAYCDPYCDPYWDKSDRVLHDGVDAVEVVAFAPTDQPAALRSVSPLGRFISVSERNQLLREARQVA
jgi:hypothetical protein